jgi:hypothetical protein
MSCLKTNRSLQTRMSCFKTNQSFWTRMSCFFVFLRQGHPADLSNLLAVHQTCRPITQSPDTACNRILQAYVAVRLDRGILAPESKRRCNQKATGFNPSCKVTFTVNRCPGST